MITEASTVIGGVDKYTHYAAAVDQHGRLLCHQEFPATDRGYHKLLAWMRRHGQIRAIGVESTGSFGATLTRALTKAAERAVEVNRPKRLASWKILDEKIKTLNRQLDGLVRAASPQLVELHGVGVELAGQFLVTVGDNPDAPR